MGAGFTGALLGGHDAQGGSGAGDGVGGIGLRHPAQVSCRPQHRQWGAPWRLLGPLPVSLLAPGAAPSSRAWGRAGHRRAETGGEGASGGGLPAGLAPRVSLLLSLFSREISDSTASARSPQGGSGQEQPRPTLATAHASPVPCSLRQIPDVPSHAAGIGIPMLSGWECLQAVQLRCFWLCEVSVWEGGGASP